MTHQQARQAVAARARDAAEVTAAAQPTQPHRLGDAAAGEREARHGGGRVELRQRRAVRLHVLLRGESGLRVRVRARVRLRVRLRLRVRVRLRVGPGLG